MPNKKIKVVIIEDYDILLKAFMEGLRHRGFIVYGADNGKEGLHLILKKKPDIILLDLVLPDIPGEEILRLLNDNGYIKKIPVVVLTNKTDKANAFMCVEGLGARDYFVKVEHTIDDISKKIKDIVRNG